MKFTFGRYCYACGDPAVGDFQKKPVCQACYEELKDGTIRNQNINFCGGIPSTREDDAGPWQQNAIRDMEDGR